MPHRFALLIVLALAGGLTGLHASAAPQRQRLDPVALLELYAAGRVDEAIAQVRAADDEAARLLRLDWRTRGSEWIDAARPNHGRRLLITAALVLETEHLRVERGDWGGFFPMTFEDRPQPCQGPCMMDWARHLLVERGLKDDAAHAWYVAALTLVEGQRDWRYLYAPSTARDPLGGGRGLAQFALADFPDDPQFRFSRALSLASRFNVTTDGGPRTGAPSEFITLASTYPNAPAGPMSAGTTLLVRAAAGEFTALLGDAAVGLDAQIRLGYLHWATGNDAGAIDAWTNLTGRTSDADRRYLAYFLLGWAALQRGEDDAARMALVAALDARPQSQSAALVLAALDIRNGDGDAAHNRVLASLTTRATDDDPWRLFLYGRYPKLPRFIAALRAEVVE